MKSELRSSLLMMTVAFLMSGGLNTRVSAQEQSGGHTKEGVVSVELNWPGITWQKSVFGLAVRHVPLDMRTVPVHRDDPFISLDPLPDVSPFSREVRLSDDEILWHMIGVKVWFYSTIGFGIRLQPVSDDLVGDNFGKGLVGESYNYAPHYGPRWGAAYIAYKIGIREESSVFPWLLGNDFLSVSVEVKSPMVWFSGDETFGVSLVGSFRPLFRTVTVYAYNGWDRWGTFELNKSEELGTSYHYGEYSVGLEGGGDFFESDDEETVRVRTGGVRVRLALCGVLRETSVSGVGRAYGLQLLPLPLGVECGFGMVFYLR
jgi:hypothetical protein